MMSIALCAYVLLLMVAELAVTLVNPLYVFLLHGGLIAALTTRLAIERNVGDPHPTRPTDDVLLIALIVAPLIRIISLTLPLPQIEASHRYLFAGIPMAVGGILAARVAGLSWRDVGIRWSNTRLQFGVIVLSVGLGFVEFVILRQSAIGPFPWQPAGIVPALSVGIFTGFPEELIFRGVMQTATRPILGRWNWVYVSAIFAVLHIGYQSYIDILFVFAVGLLYGWVFERTRSIIGISIAHGVANVVLFFVAPNMIPVESVPALALDGQIAVGLAGTLALAFAGLLWQRGLLGDPLLQVPIGEPPSSAARAPTASIARPAAGTIGPLRFSIRAEHSAKVVDPERGVVPAQAVVLPIISPWTFRASHEETRESRATGSVRFESRNREQQVIIPPRTAVSTRSGVVFRTLDGVVLPPATDGRPTSLDVVVEAGVPGPEGKVPARAISVVDPELHASHVSVQNLAPTHGGSRVRVRRITQADYLAARDAAVEQAWQEFRRLVGEHPTGHHVALDTTRLEVTVAEPSAATIVGQVADSVEITVHLVGTATAVALEAMREAAIARLRGSLPEDAEIQPGSATGRVIEAVAEGENVRYTVEITARRATNGDRRAAHEPVP
jgi:membrane protease YdiL (CAAX protease family)